MAVHREKGIIYGESGAVNGVGWVLEGRVLGVWGCILGRVRGVYGKGLWKSVGMILGWWLEEVCWVGSSGVGQFPGSWDLEFLCFSKSCIYCHKIIVGR